MTDGSVIEWLRSVMMTRYLSGLSVAGLGLCGGGWLVVAALAFGGFLARGWVDGLVEGDAMDDEASVAGCGDAVGCALPELRDHMDGLAGLGEQARDVAGVGADAAGRVGRRGVLAAEDEMGHWEGRTIMAFWEVAATLRASGAKIAKIP